MPVHEDSGVYDQNPPGSSSELPTSSGPSPLSETPGSVEEPLPDSLVEQTDETAEQDDKPLPEFNPKYREAFEGLLYLGYLEDKFRWFHHEFEIKTLNSQEVLQVAVAVKEYADTIGAARAYATAIAAACIKRIDRQRLPFPLFIDADDQSSMNERFEYMLRYHPMIIDKIYSTYLELESTVVRIVEAMGEAAG